MKTKNPLLRSLLLPGAILLLAVVLTLCGRGMNIGLDFTGGLSMHFDLGAAVTRDEVAAALPAGASVTVQGEGKNEALVRTRAEENADVQQMQADTLARLLEKWPETVSVGEVSYVGPVAGEMLVRNAVTSVLIATALMLLYIAWKFDLHTGLSAVLALLHDVAIMLAFMVILRDAVELNSSFIAAALTIVGYSINDTIVVFDRIRENAAAHPDMTRVALASRSVRESLGRTIMTTLTTLITITALYILGVDAIREFALPIIVGVVAGTYSSNLISPFLWAWLEEKFPKKEKTAESDDDEDD